MNNGGPIFILREMGEASLPAATPPPPLFHLACFMDFSADGSNGQLSRPLCFNCTVSGGGTLAHCVSECGSVGVRFKVTHQSNYKPRVMGVYEANLCFKSIMVMSHINSASDIIHLPGEGVHPLPPLDSVLH